MKNKEKNKKSKKKLWLTCAIFISVLLLLALIPLFVMAGTDTVVTVGERAYNIGNFGGYFGAVFAKKSEQERHWLRANNWERYTSGMIRCVNALIPVPKSTIPEQEYESTQFYAGNSSFQNEPGEGWRLGYAQRSTVPQDVLEQSYRTGGNLYFPMVTVKSVLDETKVRVIALDDGSGRGIHVFAAVDCIGLSNSYIRTIRAALADFAAEQQVVTLNLFSTHAHSAVDTMGIWSASGGLIAKNWASLVAGKSDLDSGANAQYLAFLSGRVCEAVREAVENMEVGKLYVSQIGARRMQPLWEDIDKTLHIDENTEWTDELNEQWDALWKEYDIASFGLTNYIWAKRNPYDCSPQLTKFRFVPENPQKKETILANMAAHPYSNGLKLKGQGGADGLSGDYPYYMERIINEAGANFLFINGAINGVYTERGSALMFSYDEEQFDEKELSTLPLATQTERMGEDLGRILLAMNRTPEAIQADPLTAPEGKTAAYRDSVRRMGLCEPTAETELPPLIHASIREVRLDAQNPLLQVIGKLNLAQYQILRAQDGSFCTMTELGYLELGGKIKVAMVPGEYTPGLVNGQGDALGENVISGKDFDKPSLEESAGEDVLVFGLANDAIGYVIPDNDFLMLHLGNGSLPRKLFGNNYTHYQEMFSLGKNTASTLAQAFQELTQGIERN